MDLLVPAQVGHDGEVSPATFHVACKCCSSVSLKFGGIVGIRVKLTLLAGVAVHMRLQRRRAREPLVADLALVLLLGVGGHLRAELAHHGLGSRGRATGQKAGWPREGPRLVRLGGGRAVVGHGRVHGAHGGAVVGVVSTGRNGGGGGVGRGESIGIGGASRIARTRAVDVARGQILAQRDHSAAGVERVTEGGSGRGWLGRAHASISGFCALESHSNGSRAKSTYECEMRRASWGCEG